MLDPLSKSFSFVASSTTALRCVCPIGVAILVQATFFAAAHPYQPVGIVVAGSLGLALAGIYEWRGTLLTPIFVHAMSNGIYMIGIVAAVMANAKAPVLGVWGARYAGAGCGGTGHPSHRAEKADLRPGDVILSYNNVAIDDFEQLVELARAGRVGDSVRIEVLRGETRLEKRVTLGPRPAASEAPDPPAP